MQRRKSFFNNEMEQRFSLRKYTIGLCSVCLGFVTIGMGSQSVKANTVNNVEKSPVVQENKMQDADSATAKPNTTPTETKKNEVGSVATTAPKTNTTSNGVKANTADSATSTEIKPQETKLAKTADSNNSASVNTLDQSKSENSSAVAPTSEKTQLQTSQDSSIKSKENSLNNKSNAMKAVFKLTNLNKENNSSDPNSKDVEVKPKESSNVDTNEQKETSTALPKQPANADTQLAATTSGVQPFVNLAVESDNNDLTPKHETIDSQWTIHYVNQADHKQELKDPTVITMQYTRTNTPQSDGKIQYGDWSYVPDSFKQTGTPITVKDSNNPVKQDNVDKNGENFDVFTITAMYPTVAGYGFYNGINGTRLRDNLRNNERQADAMSKDFYAEYDVAKPTRETVGSQWRIHYIDSTNHEHELKAPTVINMQYVRTNTPQSDGTIQHGDWSYVPGSFKLTGTPITVNDGDNPVKEDNVDKDGQNVDTFTINAMYPSITGYNFHDGINNVHLHDYLLNYDPNGTVQAPTMGRDFDVEYDPISERSVAVKFVDDQSYDFNTSDHKKQVGQAITLTGRDGDTVNLNLTVPDKYQLADGQQLPTTYTFAKGSGDLKIHLVHKVVQREAAIDVQLVLTTSVHQNDYAAGTITQARWKQLGDKVNDGVPSPSGILEVLPLVKAGTSTGHVDYDLVDERVTSLENDWTTLNLGGKTYQLPNGDEVVNGIMVDGDTTWGRPFKEFILKIYQITHDDVDSDYVNRPWHGYLSVNATNNDSNGFLDEVHSLGLQAGLVGDEPNALAKAIGDRAATGVEIANKPIDLDLLQNWDFEFSEQNGQLRADVFLPLAGVYVPYVEKTATRTINVTTPDGKTTAVKQTVTLAKQVDLGKDAHPSWTTGEWSSYDVPTIPGYTASQSNVAKETVTGATKDQTVNISYTANPQTATVVYQTEDGTPVHTTTVNGHTGQTVKVSNEVPVGWHVVNGTLPSEITFGPNGTPKTVVTIAHSHATVTPDAPKTISDKLPDNPAKTYPAGVSETDLNNTVTRTIKVTTPDGQVKTVVKTAHLTRTADVDEVTGEVTYSDWTTGYWSDYTAPSVPGYTANYPYIAGQLVDGETTDQTIEITYTANDGTQTIVYQDEDGSEIGKQVISGKTDEKVKVTSDVPDGYVLKGEVPSEVTIKPDDTPITVTVEHGKSHVTPDKPVNKGDLIPDTKDKHYPEGLTHNDLNKTVTREITITDPTGKKTTTTQTVTFTRGATVDEVTNKVTYDDWSENGKHTFDKVEVPTVQGYTASQNEVPATEVTSDMTDQTIDISYTANSQTIHINYVDDEKADEIVYTTAVTGKTGETVSLNLTVPDKYQLANGQQLPTTYTFTNGSGDLKIHLAHQVVQREATVDVQIGFMTLVDLNDEFEPVSVVTQNQWLQLDDEIKKDDSLFNDLEKVIPSVEVGTITGHVNYDLVDNKVVSFGNDWTTLNLGGQTYQMPDGTEVVNGVLTDSTDLWGKSFKEQLLKYSSDIDPDYVNRAWKGYLSVNKSHIDSDYTGFRLVGNEPNTLSKATGDRAATAIEMTNKPIDLSSLGRRVMVDELSDFTEQDGHLRAKATFAVVGVYIPYVEKTATRTINVTTPDGKTTAVKQTATLAKQVDFADDAHPDWTTSEWTSYDVPVIPGYTASQSNVAKEAVTGTTKDQTVNITYTANDGTQTIVYQDEDGSEIGKQVISGKTDEKVKVTPDVPDGYVLKGEVPSEVTIKPDDTPITITIEHGKSHIDPDKPVNSGEHIPGTTDKTYPSGLTHDDLNKTITREVTITDPTGKKSTTAQTVTFTRGATVDEVTNKVTYDDWSENGKHTFDKVEVPTVQGYTASGEVPSIVVTPETQSSKVDITYTANAQTATIIYIDDTEKKSLGSDKENGKFNQVITFEHDPAEVIKGLEEKGYKLVLNDFNSNKYQADNSNNVFYVHLKHGTSESSRKDDVNMTVHYVMDDGSKAPSDSKQTVSFTESGIKDNVTGNITWMPVASQTLKDVDSPVLTGYTADIKTANGKVVNFGDPDINVTVHYSANAQTATITYIDDTEKKSLGSDKQNGKFNQVITFEHDPAEVIKGLEEKGYKLVSDNFKSGVKYQNDNKSNSFEVHLVHSYEPVETSQTITETVHYIDANGKPVAPDHVATVVVKVTGTRDKVTDSITWNTPSTGHFDKVISPKLPNMTPDKKLIPSRDVQYGDSDITESVVYTPDEIPSEPEEPNDQGKPNSKTPEKPNKPDNSTSKTSEKPNKPSNLASKTSEKSNKSSKEVSKQFGTIAKTTIPEKLIDSRTVDNHVSAKSTAKQELPQTGATTNTGIWTGLVSMIAGLGLVGASKKRKKN